MNSSTLQIFTGKVITEILKDLNANTELFSFLLKNCFHAKKTVQCSVSLLVCFVALGDYTTFCVHSMYLLLKTRPESETFLMLHICIQTQKTNVSRSTAMTQEGICIS